MIPLAVPNLAGREAQYLQECVDSTFVSSVGPFVDRLERQVAEASGSARAVAVSTGTAGLHVALRAVGVGADDLVALPSLTFVASANAIAYCGAEPWLFDVSDDSLTLDAEQLADVLNRRLEPGPEGPVERRSQRRLAAIMPVHTLGHPADMDVIVEVANAWGVPVVADAAAALGARHRGRMVGELGALLSVFSFNGNKTVTAGGGGAVVTNDPVAARTVKHLSTTARVGSDYDHDEIGFNYRMTNVQAAVGSAQLEQLDGFVARKRQISAFYAGRLGGLPGCREIPQAEWAESACWFSGIVVDNRSPTEIQELRFALRAEGIDVRPFRKQMHLQKPYADAMREPVPTTTGVWQRVVNLPCSTGITDAELDQVAEAVCRQLTA